MQTPAHPLWHEFGQSRSAELKRQLVLQYLDLVRYVVVPFGAKMRGKESVLESQDLLQYGIVGLIAAIDRFNPSTGVKFETYAVPRIRGAIQDGLRAVDWIPRSVRAGSRKLEKAADDAAQQSGREPAESEIAGQLEMSVEEYREFLSKASRGQEPQDTESPDTVAEQALDPLEQLSDDESRAILVDAIEKLPPRSRAVIALYYYEGLTLGEIGKILRVSESRVSQIHAEVLRGLRLKLTQLVP